MLAHLLLRYVARESVEMDRGDYRLRYPLGILGYEAGYDPGQYVAGASGCHARISRGIHPDFPAGLGNQGAMTLKHHNQLVITSKFAGHADAVALNRGDGRTQKACHLAGVGRNYERPSLAA